MATEITMPKLSDTMTEGVLAAWRKHVGETVARGEILAEVETDKATMELESFVTGVLLEIRVQAGETVPVGGVIALVGAEGEQPAAAPVTPPEPQRVVPAATLLPAAVPEPGEVPERILELPEPVVPAAERASPLVRRLARERGVDLAKVSGTGPGGRILREDLEAMTASVGQVGSGEPVPYASGGTAGYPRPLSRMRAAIARKVLETWRTTPHFAVTVQVDMAEAERLYLELKAAGHLISLNDFVVKACAEALPVHPAVNSSLGDGGITEHPSINIGVAVALEEGVVIPVIRECHRLTLREISAESRRLAAKARSGRLTEAELAGGTFTVSNLGMYGVDEFMAVINAPQAAILAVGGVADRPVVRGGAIVPGRLMNVTLSADHRLLDGVTAARFLAELKRVLENPAPLLL